MAEFEPDPASDHLLQEYATLEYILLGDLRDVLEDDPDDDTTAHWLLAVLDALLETLPREFELQEQGGYLSEVLDQYPNWSGHVVRLQEEREQLFARLADFRELIARQQHFAEIAAQMRTDLRDWMARLTAHHRHERRLVQSAFNVECGAGD